VGSDAPLGEAPAFEAVDHHGDERGVAAPPVGQLPHGEGVAGVELEEALEHGRREAQLGRRVVEHRLVLRGEEQIGHGLGDQPGGLLFGHA
jgi:hypothetical protein